MKVGKDSRSQVYSRKERRRVQKIADTEKKSKGRGPVFILRRDYASVGSGLLCEKGCLEGSHLKVGEY